MKNQYFGDIGDYKKFNLLRTITRVSGLRIYVCWMLTENDGSNDGRFTQYLLSSKWSIYDPAVFEFLKNAVINNKERDLKLVESSNLMANVGFHSVYVPSGLNERKQFMDELIKAASTYDIIFFDPDNGIEVKSTTIGKKGSQKYLFWREIKYAYGRGFSLIIYQHFPRVDRERFIVDTVNAIRGRLESRNIFTIKMRHAVFFIIPTNNPDQLELSLRNFVEVWGNQVSVKKHSHLNQETLENKKQFKMF